MTDEIIKRAKKLEDDYRIEQAQNTPAPGDTDTSADMQSLFKTTTNSTEEDKDLEVLNGIEDPNKDEENIRELLKQAGVVYSHLNTDVIGETEIEKQIAAKASKEYDEQILIEKQREENRLREYTNNLKLQQMLQNYTSQATMSTPSTYRMAYNPLVANNPHNIPIQFSNNISLPPQYTKGIPSGVPIIYYGNGMINSQQLPPPSFVNRRVTSPINNIATPPTNSITALRQYSQQQQQQTPPKAPSQPTHTTTNNKSKPTVVDVYEVDSD